MTKGGPQTALEPVQLERLDVPSRELINAAGEFGEPQPGLAAAEFSFAGADRVPEKKTARSTEFNPTENLDLEAEAEIIPLGGGHRRRLGRRRITRVRKLLLGTRGLDVLTKIMRWLERLLSSLADRILGERRNQMPLRNTAQKQQKKVGKEQGPASSL